MTNRERQLCTRCGGNGVLKIPGGVETCCHCDGDCWEPCNQASDSLRAAAADMFVALNQTMTALRRVRDEFPFTWDELMASEAGPALTTAWDANKTAIAKAEGK